ncbi:4'-phosphopantetheinyl transferase superfamily protein [Cryobacterium sp. PAMC25264]|uniref:4'-phosphopantetheinyl transferase family protein n=1 Tax=Cryobacterium sp. PAMC25264 TaxID=2861288 RepID=UPI001C63891B|nr:4'-phosphopantetheinyl transferase superfamily protein [Cryobacterium sp. PAMC25264]QYF72478.1 4'-phosphopantetheinyl transferase superfamily protein [Cryobacterium sp. PAMC25264]
MSDAPTPVNGPPATGSPGSALPGSGASAIDLSRTVAVAVGDRAETRAGDHALLAGMVARLTGAAAASVVLTRRCPHCGASDHGPLRVRIPGFPAVVPRVSLARAGGRLALAVTAAGPVGIDLESLADLARAPLHDVALSPAEAATLATLRPAAAAEAALANIWTTKEAVLKAAGLGLRVDPRELTVTLEPAGRPDGPSPRPSDRRTVSWPRAPFPDTDVQLWPVAAPRGTVATVAVVCGERPSVLMVTVPPPR